METITFKENDKIYAKEYSDAEVLNEFRKNRHICYYKSCCVNSSPSKCEKIGDQKLKSIEDYPFVIKGMEIRGQDGEIIRQRIIQCSNYKQQDLQKLTKERAEEVDKLIISMITGRYDVDTLEEGIWQLYENGKLDIGNGDDEIDKETFAKIRKKIKK